MIKFYNYKQLTNVIESIPKEYKSFPICFSVNWDGNDFLVTDTKSVGRRVRLIISEPIDAPRKDSSQLMYNDDHLLDLLSKCNNSHEISFKSGDKEEFYTLSNLNYQVGQNAIYFCIRRVG